MFIVLRQPIRRLQTRRHQASRRPHFSTPRGLWKDCKVQGRKLVKVLTCSVPPVPFRAVLLDSLVGLVVEVEGAEVWPSGALRHAIIQRLRNDKPAQECTHDAAMRVR